MKFDSDEFANSKIDQVPISSKRMQVALQIISKRNVQRNAFFFKLSDRSWKFERSTYVRVNNLILQVQVLSRFRCGRIFSTKWVLQGVEIHSLSVSDNKTSNHQCPHLIYFSHSYVLVHSPLHPKPFLQNTFAITSTITKTIVIQKSDTS